MTGSASCADTTEKGADNRSLTKPRLPSRLCDAIVAYREAVNQLVNGDWLMVIG